MAERADGTRAGGSDGDQQGGIDALGAHGTGQLARPRLEPIEFAERAHKGIVIVRQAADGPDSASSRSRSSGNATFQSI